ncbi:uncharacterized protein LOC114355433 isoform X2 [Ostrinia furnacalis]|uniref:uncharacterized protein LOC114355433 isoform X1 n=1 Tax=Ostrinia furnacalis TaxID=93504 RepID=UPI00103FE55B|nr:uncharacterized protein LOC114355433 isoform X1 [Ostrinia furnacalis]XP_028164186.1 uncharacterized protein LOC114355433 isoform X2 [Ostrinia furnacalis]
MKSTIFGTIYRCLRSWLLFSLAFPRLDLGCVHGPSSSGKVCQTSSGWESRSDGDANFGALRRSVVHWRCLSGAACLEEQHPEELELLQQGSELGGESGFGLRDGAGADAGEEVPSGASSGARKGQLTSDVTRE